MDNIERNCPVVASFPARKDDHLMLVTNQAKLIRMGLDSLRVIGRKSAGVRLFNVADNEHVVSAAKIEDDGDETSQIGRASGRERVCQYVSISVVAGTSKKKQKIRRKE